MEEMKLHGDVAIGSEFELNGKRFIVVRNLHCNACAFYCDNDCCDMACSAMTRTDGANVGFKKVEIIVAPEKADAKR